MIKLVLAAALAVLVAALYSQPSVISQLKKPKPISHSQIKQEFDNFLIKYRKNYANDANEYNKRLVIFAKNLEKTRIMNMMHNDTVYGVTKFSDLTPEEFRAKYLSKQPISRPSKLEHGHFVDSVPVPNDLPTYWNWNAQGAVTPVKDQGECGSCWSFSTVGNLEGQYYLAGKSLTSLSAQQFVDCDHTCNPDDPDDCNSGCDGGLMSRAFSYAMANGVEQDKDYSYTAVTGECKYNQSQVVLKVKDFKMLPTDEDQLAAYLVEHGPLSAALDAHDLQYYTGGVFDPLVCDPKQLDHAVLIVGYGVADGFLSHKKYWLVKNSWGVDFAEQGYFRIARGKSKCGINTRVCTGEL